MPARPPKRRVRAPDATRGKILAAAFEEMYQRGFQAASLDTIVEQAGVTKGALYHHFADKAALGYAVVDEVITRPVLDVYLGPLQESTVDPLTALQQLLRRRADDFRSGGIELGCPLNNLAQEMSPLDERFRRHVEAALDAWTDGFARALRRGQTAGTVRKDVNARAVAAFMVATVEGSFGMAKNAKSQPLLRANLELLASFLETLRPPRRRRRNGVTRRSTTRRAA
ncbi:MAG TPA: TetR/AcrR family transcriptional regulator [Gemmatimonadales bacterium]